MKTLLSPLSLCAGVCLLLSAPCEAGKGHHAHHALSGVHSLDVVGHEATLDLLTGVYLPGQERAVLQHQRSRDGGESWSAPLQVDAGMPAAHAPHRGMDAQIAAAGDRLVAVWMTAGTDRFGGGPMATALSADGGKTWQAGPNPADDGSTSGHGFIDIAAGPGGVFHLTWFDTREERRGLRYASSADGGRTWTANATPDAETCECCWNVIVAGADGSVGILYRDKAPRDMSLAISTDGGKNWTGGKTVGSFGWQFDGCPHVGGGFAVGGSSEKPVWHATVWTGQADRLGLYYLKSEDRAGTWADPVRLGDDGASHPDVGADVQGRVAAVWHRRMGEVTVIESAFSLDEGKTWSAPSVLSRGSANATHPRLIPADGGLRAFWTEQTGEAPAQWRSHLIPFPVSHTP